MWVLTWFSDIVKRATRGSRLEVGRLRGKSIAIRADGFRGRTMRSVDDIGVYYAPVKQRGWVKPNGHWRKRNKLRSVPIECPDKRIPKKIQENKLGLEYWKARQTAHQSYQVTLGPWSEC